MFLTRCVFMMNLMVEHVSKMIRFGVIVLVVGAFFVVWVMVIPTCSKYDPTEVLDSKNGKFKA